MNDGKLYHFRTGEQKEIDFVIKKRDGSLLALEVKASTAVSPEDFKHIRFLSQALLQGFIRGTL
jgi:predicted AAA+ superfamily ATPase